MGTEGFIQLTSDRQLRQLLDRGADLKRFFSQPGSDLLLDLGKSWGALHFLLTGTANDGDPPLNFILSGGRWIDGFLGDRDLRFVRFFASEALPEVAAALDQLAAEEIQRRFDGPKMDRLGVSPGWWSDFGTDMPPHLLEQVDEVRNHLHLGVQHQLGMIIWLE